MGKNDVLRSLVERTVIEIAPEEASLVSAYSENDQLFGSTGKGARGFGVETSIILLTPILYKFFDALLGKLATKAADAFVSNFTKWILSDGDRFSEEVKTEIGEELVKAGLPADRKEDVVNKILPILMKEASSLHKANS